MHNPDISREKSLYHLLMTVVRRLNAPITPHKKQISEALKSLAITKSDGEYFLVINDSIKQRHTSIPVSELKFYDTKNDATIAEKNLRAATRIALELFPELNTKGALNRSVKRLNYIDLLFTFYSISLLLFYILDLQVLLGVPASLAFGFIPFWNLSSNLNPRVRWFGSVVFSLLCFALFYSPSSGSWVDIHLAIMLGLFFLIYCKKGPLRIFFLLLLAVLLGLVVFFEDYRIAVLAIVFVAVEKFIELLFRMSKKMGLLAFAIIFISTIVLMYRELAKLKNPYLAVSLGAILFGYLLFNYGVGSSWGGFLRTILPSLGALSLTGTDVAIYLSTTLVLFSCVKLTSNLVDGKLDAT